MVAAAFGQPVEADLVERIRSSAEYVPDLALVALDGDEVVGHVMVSHARIASTGRRIAMLSPLAVRPDRHGQGIGSRLVNEVVAATDARREALVVLEGDPRYYGRLGFEPAAAHGLRLPLPDWAPPEAAQVRLLAAHDPDDETLRGEVVYPAAFDGLE